MYTLYGKKGSGSASTQAALEIIGAPYRIVETASWDPNAAFAELLKLNPLGQIPTLVLPDGSVLSESAAILIHLGSVHPDSGLLPRDASARAQAIRGLVFIAANCYAAISIIDFPERWCEDADEATQERIRAGTRARLHRHWEMFADLFPARPYLGGEKIGALDSSPPSCRNGRDPGRICSRRARRSTKRCCASKRNPRSRRCSRSTGRPVEAPARGEMPVVVPSHRHHVAPGPPSQS